MYKGYKLATMIVLVLNAYFKIEQTAVLSPVLRFKPVFTILDDILHAFSNLGLMIHYLQI